MREYGAATAVDGIDLSLARGEFLTIFGPNGAGKTSLLALLAGALRPNRGQVWLRGEALDFGEVEWRRRIGVLSHKGFLYGHLSAEENLRFYGQLFGLVDVDNVVRHKLQHLGLQERATSLVRDLSHGMRQRLALARALLHDRVPFLLPQRGQPSQVPADQRWPVLQGAVGAARAGGKGVGRAPDGGPAGGAL